jgi:hypothetical protein
MTHTYYCYSIVTRLSIAPATIIAHIQLSLHTEVAMFTAHADTDGTLLITDRGTRRVAPPHHNLRNRTHAALTIIAEHIICDERRALEIVPPGTRAPLNSIGGAMILAATLTESPILRRARFQLESKTAGESDFSPTAIPSGITRAMRLARKIQKLELEELRGEYTTQDGELISPTKSRFVDVDSIYYSPTDQSYYTREVEHLVDENWNAVARVRDIYEPPVKHSSEIHGQKRKVNKLTEPVSPNNRYPLIDYVWDRAANAYRQTFKRPPAPTLPDVSRYVPGDQYQRLGATLHQCVIQSAPYKGPRKPAFDER